MSKTQTSKTAKPTIAKKQAHQTAKRREPKAGTSAPVSKQATVIAMLRKPTGATVAAIIKSTGWQPHSVRGFFAAVIRKKLGLNLTSGGTGNKRVYKIAGTGKLPKMTVAL